MGFGCRQCRPTLGAKAAWKTKSRHGEPVRLFDEAGKAD
jgi:hypothetical protein